MTGVPLLVDARRAAELLGLGCSTWRRLVVTGRAPRAIRFGRATRWRVDELRDWLAAGAPTRERWDAARGIAR